MRSRRVQFLTMCALFGVILVGAGCDQSNSAGNAADAQAVQAAQRSPDQAAPSRTPPAQPPSRTAPARDQAPPRGQEPGAPAGTNFPPIEFDPPTLDFAVVRPNVRLSRTVYIQNNSDQPLLIERTKASCTCTSVDLANTPIGPGERIDMPIDFHSGILTGPKSAGVRVFVKGFDFIEYPLKAFVTLPISVDPSFVNSVKDGEGNIETKGEYTLNSLDGKPFHVLAVNGATPAFVGFDPEKDEYRNTYVLGWNFAAYDPATCLNPAGQRLPGSIVIETDHPECPVLDIEVRHECTRRPMKKPAETWYIQDKRVLAGLMKDAEWYEFELPAKWYPKITTKDPVKTIQCQSSQFTAELVRVEPEKDGFIVHVRVKPAPGFRGLVYDEVVLKSLNESWPITIVGSVR